MSINGHFRRINLRGKANRLLFLRSLFNIGTLILSRNVARRHRFHAANYRSMLHTPAIRTTAVIATKTVTTTHKIVKLDESHLSQREREIKYIQCKPPARSKLGILNMDSQCIQMATASPTMSRSGTCPQTRLSLLLSRLSPIMK